MAERPAEAALLTQAKAEVRAATKAMPKVLSGDEAAAWYAEINALESLTRRLRESVFFSHKASKRVCPRCRWGLHGDACGKCDEQAGRSSLAGDERG